MKIYADPSFLVSLLNKGELQHAAARQFFISMPDAEWITSNWSQFETVNSLRQLCRQGNTPEQVEALRRTFKHWHERGNFTFEKTDTMEAVQDCGTISAAFGTQMRMRSADTLHIALLEQIEHDLFVTRDEEQFNLARRRGLKSKLLP